MSNRIGPGSVEISSVMSSIEGNLNRRLQWKYCSEFDVIILFSAFNSAMY